MKKLVFTVTNDLTYDQRMARICSSLAHYGYEVTLIGRKTNDSVPLQKTSYTRIRLRCIFNKGFLFYAEYNVRLFFHLLFAPADGFCAIDLDTILPVFFVSVLRRKKRVYDAHELFCEMKEIASRPFVYKIWKFIERFTVPRFKTGYTVNQVIADEFHRIYGVSYGVVRNAPRLSDTYQQNNSDGYVIYQGAVNEGRSFETLIPAFRRINRKLLICGEGNFLKQAKQITQDSGVTDKVVFAGKIDPAVLKTYTAGASVGVTLFDAAGLSNYYSLANRFFDYMHAGVPQLCVNYPVYREIIERFPFALLIDNLDSDNIADNINLLLNDRDLYNQMHKACLLAREQLNWQTEEKTLVNVYQNLFFA